MTPHKHRDLIKAWADGAEIQSRHYPPNKEQQIDWRTTYNPTWTTDPYVEYRIKPKTIKYRVALCKVGDLSYTTTANNDSSLSYPDNTRFVEWLTDWVEVENNV